MTKVVAIQSLSRVRLFVTPRTAARQTSLSFTISQSLLKFMSIESVMPSSHFTLSPLLLPSIFPSIKIFSSESLLCSRWPKYWSFSISPSNECSELISFRIDWFNFLAVQGTLKGLLQHHCSKASVLQGQPFFKAVKTGSWGLLWRHFASEARGRESTRCPSRGFLYP